MKHPSNITPHIDLRKSFHFEIDEMISEGVAFRGEAGGQCLRSLTQMKRHAGIIEW